jgi:hypothetical protein
MRCDRWNTLYHTPVADREQAVTICVLFCLVLTNGLHQWLSGGDKKQKQKKRLTEIMTGHQSAGMLLLLPIEMKNAARRVYVVSLGFGYFTADNVIQVRCNDPCAVYRCCI